MAGSQYFVISAPIALFAAIFTWPSSETGPTRSVAQDFVEISKGVFPKTMPDGTHIDAPRAEGNLLIFTITPSAMSLEGLSLAEVERLNMNAMCLSGGGMRSFFEKDGRIRIDFKKVDGSIAQGTPISQCTS